MAKGVGVDRLTVRAEGEEYVLMTETFAGQTVERRLECRDPTERPPSRA